MLPHHGFGCAIRRRRQQAEKCGEGQAYRECDGEVWMAAAGEGGGAHDYRSASTLITADE